MAFRPMIRRGTCAAVLAVGLVVPASAQTVDSLPPAPATPTGWSAPALHISLSASFASLQTLDVVTTLRSVHSGAAVEANPLVAGLARHPAALVGLKAGLTAATIVSMRGFAKAHPKAAALTLIGLNVGSAFVVGSNFRVSSAR
jgi:hypothetical protein